jgi:hypothetical protein
MTPLFKKLNFKDQKAILIINIPDSFKAPANEMNLFTKVIFDPSDIKEIEFAIIFVTKKIEISAALKDIEPLLKSNAVFWFCYPKQSSKKYKCEFNRDNGWAQLGDLGYEGVRMVAIDEDWSALRFRKVEDVGKRNDRHNNH